MDTQVDYHKAYLREKKARQQAETILEAKASELYEKNQSLLAAYNKLKDQKAQLLHQEKLASLGQLAAGVAHEINNPTSFVKSNLSMLQSYNKQMAAYLHFIDHQIDEFQNLDINQLQSKKAEYDIDYLQGDLSELIHESLDGVTRIEEIVKSLKGFARPSDNIKQDFQLNDCITNTLKLVINEIKYKAELELSLAPLPEIPGYPGEICQVVLNLLVNASQAIETKGLIGITTFAEANQLVLIISDNGCGIEEQHVNKLFDPFFTTKDVDQGTGLGLSITHSIIKKHQGTIEVESQLGAGSCFTIRLPIHSN